MIAQLPLLPRQAKHPRSIPSNVLQRMQMNHRALNMLSTAIVYINNTPLESIEDEPRNLNSQAKFCEEHFVNNHRRDESEQYIVQMAFLKEPSCLGESKQTAIRRLNSLWRKLDANPNLKTVISRIYP
ncbi:uncharacterized protein TNCV_2045931 [Trichonephila clavipes]|uniref:Uncharacterized protein n=1 Tax=Trichonephila clavipes TaxID=2585209 RepID=A0A8X6VGX3_TRICX|nr:uncharacterized protein TNCV_2045931 [Trichonephila clavipes]